LHICLGTPEKLRIDVIHFICRSKTSVCILDAYLSSYA
jgi:hypothetical protein